MSELWCSVKAMSAVVAWPRRDLSFCLVSGLCLLSSCNSEDFIQGYCSINDIFVVFGLNDGEHCSWIHHCPSFYTSLFLSFDSSGFYLLISLLNCFLLFSPFLWCIQGSFIALFVLLFCYFSSPISFQFFLWLLWLVKSCLFLPPLWPE